MNTLFTELSSRISGISGGKISHRLLPVCCLLLVCVSVIFTLVDSSLSRQCFFIAGYIALVVVCLNIRHFRHFLTPVSLMLLLLALVKVVWFLVFYGDAAIANMYNSHMQAGKRLFFVVLIMVCLTKYRHFLPEKTWVLKAVFWLAFVLTSVIGVIQVARGMDRIEFHNTRATDASYMYSCISLTLAFLLLSRESLRGYVLAFAVFLSSYWLVLHTGTRSAMALHPIIFLVCLLFNSHSRYKLRIVLAAMLAMACLIFAFKGEVTERVRSTSSDLSVYLKSEGNDATSLGTRLAMWQVGLAVFAQHPWGMSTEQRFAWMSRYVDQHGTDKSALDYAMVHLHDESIETASLQGIIGLIVLWGLYLVVLRQSIKQRNTLLLLTLLCLVGYGLTDVLLISREQTIFFGLMITLSCLYAPRGSAQGQTEE